MGHWPCFDSLREAGSFRSACALPLHGGRAFCCSKVLTLCAMGKFSYTAHWPDELLFASEANDAMPRLAFSRLCLRMRRVRHPFEEEYLYRKTAFKSVPRF